MARKTEKNMQKPPVAKDKFVVGNIVTCKKNATQAYAYTSPGVPCKVREVGTAGAKYMTVEILPNPINHNHGETFDVLISNFMFWKESKEEERKEFQRGDFVQAREDITTHREMKKGWIGRVQEDETAGVITVSGAGEREYRFYAREFEKIENPTGLDHRHLWDVKWEEHYRQCGECGLRQWRLECWTGHDWVKKAPADVFKARPDLDEFKINGGANFVWTNQPHRIRSRDLIGDHIIHEPINIIGAGAIGSFTALAIMKMGFSAIRIWDAEHVGVENIGTQLYGQPYVGIPKVGALKDMLNRFGPENRNGEDFKITTKAERYTNQKLHGVVVMAVDSMEARRTIWEAQKANKRVSWVIDGRMGAEQALMYAMNPQDPADVISYEKTLYTDAAAVAEPCTAAGTVYTALLISGMICKAVKDTLTEKAKYPRIVMWNIKDNQQTVYHKGQTFEAPQVYEEAGAAK